VDRSLWEITGDIWCAIEGFQDSRGRDNSAMRIVKLAEEVGEVSQAFIGYKGMNKRKGFTHTSQDVAKELCDVLVTAMVALEDYVNDPPEFFGKFLLELEQRVREQGS
jgi:hypothetical protein